MFAMTPTEMIWIDSHNALLMLGNKAMTELTFTNKKLLLYQSLPHSVSLVKENLLPIARKKLSICLRISCKLKLSLLKIGLLSFDIFVQSKLKFTYSIKHRIYKNFNFI